MGAPETRVRAFAARNPAATKSASGALLPSALGFDGYLSPIGARKRPIFLGITALLELIADLFDGTRNALQGDSVLPFVSRSQSLA